VYGVPNSCELEPLIERLKAIGSLRDLAVTIPNQGQFDQ